MTLFGHVLALPSKTIGFLPGTPAGLDLLTPQAPWHREAHGSSDDLAEEILDTLRLTVRSTYPFRIAAAVERGHHENEDCHGRLDPPHLKTHGLPMVYRQGERDHARVGPRNPVSGGHAPRGAGRYAADPAAIARRDPLSRERARDAKRWARPRDRPDMAGEERQADQPADAEVHPPAQDQV